MQGGQVTTKDCRLSAERLATTKALVVTVDKTTHSAHRLVAQSTMQDYHDKKM
jgi:hypothetical protein